MTTSPEEEAGRQVPTNKLRAGGADIAGSDSRVATTSPSHECGPSLGQVHLSLSPAKSS